MTSSHLYLLVFFLCHLALSTRNIFNGLAFNIGWPKLKRQY
uniref:Uncharacterized protein n=1 Tax=Aegilops tauschii subsp. strangulata TaxID=200361 RepID=A0A453NFF7_AEGTS